MAGRGGAPGRLPDANPVLGDKETGVTISMASWFGDLSRPVDIYCERTGATFVAEPLNAISNVAFFVAAWAAWHLLRQRPDAAFRAPVLTLCAIVAVIGAGSLTFHTVATRWAEWADVVPILIFMMVYCWLILTAFFRWPVWMKILCCLAFFAATFFLESDAFETFLWGGAMYLPTLVFLAGAGIGIWRSGSGAARAFFAAAGLFVLSFTARTLDQPLCSAIPIGTHYFWHFFNAGTLYLLLRTVIVHAPGGMRAVLAGNPAGNASQSLPERGLGANSSV
jgi:hypothetical protein